MGSRFVIKLMFEWGTGCLWCDNDAAFERFGVGPIEDQLALTPYTRGLLQEMSVWHDGALDWSNPAGPSPWSASERERFEQCANEIFLIVRAELGDGFEVVYHPD